MRKQINEINGELNNVQVRENILKNQVQNQVHLIFNDHGVINRNYF